MHQEPSSLRLICHDLREVELPKRYIGKLTLFQNAPELTSKGYYRIQCKASQNVVNDFVNRVTNASVEVTITKDNFHELRGLSRELGFSGFDKDLDAFASGSAAQLQDLHLSQFERILRRTTRHLDAHMDTFGAQIANINQTLSTVVGRLETLENKVAALEKAKEMTEQRLNSLAASERRSSEALKKANLAVAKFNMKEFPFRESTPLDGIIQYLTRKYQGNVHDLGIVSVTGNIHTKECWGPRNIVIPQGFSRYRVIGQQELPWICWDFKERRVIPSSYSIQVFHTKLIAVFKSWVIEVSNDNASWTIIDGQDTDVLDKALFAHFGIAQVPREGFRFIRLRATGWNTRGAMRFETNFIEFFGTLCLK